jgi:diadenosine tetraphosphate (Ap4A) HIT family hydrolase
MDDQEGCLACDLTHDRRPLPGGRLLTVARWVVEHCVGPLGVGTLIVKPLRHVVRVADLTDEESLELGPLLRRVAAAVTEVLRPDQVYVCLWSHAGGAPGHLHFVVQPVGSAGGSLGPRLQAEMFERGESPDPAAVQEINARLRPVLAG